MSHLYDTIEPNVISQALLQQCVIEQGPEGEAGRLAKEEGIDFAEVLRLRLDFQNILCIENLWQFTNLKHLQLDNNIIEEITGLETLIHLEWLDLSFNNIEAISGLEKLVNLRDLSLANNRILTIENLDNLKNLQVLSLANNLIEESSKREYVIYLRQFTKLQSLTLKGNPLTSDQYYTSAVLAFVPSLVYLDFRMVLSEDEREEAREQFHSELEEIEFHEREMAKKREDQDAADQLEAKLSAAYVNGLQGSVLFDTMFEEDTDKDRISLLPDVLAMLNEYKQEFIQCCEHLTRIGLEEKEKRDKELASFNAAHEEACLHNQQLSVERVKRFEDMKLKLVPDGMSSSMSRSSADQVEKETTTLQHDLMKLEMQLVEQLDEASKDFELNYSDMYGRFKEHLQSHTTQLRELENNHHEKVTELAVRTLELFAKNQLEEELHEDLRILFVDKDTLVSALNASHDTHMLAIDNKEDDIIKRANKDLKTLLESVQEAELKRNRQKIVEIDQYIRQQREDIEDMTSPHPQ